MSYLVEVFSIIYKDKDEGGEAPSGTISAFDGKRGQKIYTRRGGPRFQLPLCGKNDVQLLLMGPHRAISADGCVAIELNLHHGCKDRRLPYVAQILVDVYDPSTVYDKIVTKEVRTCACSKSPSAEVKYALLSNAVEAAVEAKLLHPEGHDDLADGLCFYLQRIIARSDVGEVALFGCNDETTLIGWPEVPAMTIIKLARSVLAVSLTSPLTIDLELRGCSDGEMVKYSNISYPDLDTEHVLSFACKIGVVEVKIRYSDD